jgi:transcriptional regulator with XRE-family HTH domain
MEHSFNIQKILAENVRQARIQKHLTQQELAEKAGIITLSVSNIERQEAWPRPDTLEAIAVILELRPFELFIDHENDTIVPYEQVVRANSRVLELLQTELEKNCDYLSHKSTDIRFKITHDQK